MAYDEKTPHLSLPLPHPRNTLREDCPRIRESLQALDRFAEKSDAAVAALAEADTTSANPMQSQGKDLAEAISQEEQARSQADSGHDDAIAALERELANLRDVRLPDIENRFSDNGKVKAENLPLTDAVDSTTGEQAASDKAIATVFALVNEMWIGVPRFWRSTVLPPCHCWANGDFVSFSDWPDLKKVYDSGGFEGMLLPWDASSEEQAANLGKWRPDSSDNPTGLFTPNLSGQFFRNWGPSDETAPGAWASDKGRNITGQVAYLIGTTSGSIPSGCFTGTTQSPPVEVAEGGTHHEITLNFDAATVWGEHAGNEFAPVHVWQPAILYLGRPAQI